MNCRAKELEEALRCPIYRHFMISVGAVNSRNMFYLTDESEDRQRKGEQDALLMRVSSGRISLKAITILPVQEYGKRSFC